MMNDLFKDKNVLITGGVGTIGTGIVKQLLKTNVKKIRIFDNRELGLFKLQNDIEDYRVRYLLGDIRDRDRLNRAMENVDIVFHTAALKQINYCEQNPFETVKTNILGTQNVIDMAISNDVEKVVGISTDKSVNPVSTMGASKMLMERLLLDASLYKGNSRTVFSCVRFGNVLFSNASIIPLLKDRIYQKKVLELRHIDMTRFVMPLDKAVKLIFKTVELSNGGEIFILKMSMIRIIDLFYEMIHLYSDNINEMVVEVTMPQMGEKIHEELLSSYESLNAYENDELIVISPLNVVDGFKKSSLKNYSSDGDNFLSGFEIKTLLDWNGLVRNEENKYLFTEW